ncbi:MAG: putative capsular polysaccharide synthesis family protein [Myxococcota bacterium]|nr:putative capsular polysaccharide synthesis family protein [Myxococcota bacterium]
MNVFICSVKAIRHAIGYVLLEQRESGMNAVILYQMGKVGSSSLEYSLETVDVPVLHLHRIFWGSYETPFSGIFIPLSAIQKVRQRLIYRYYIMQKKAKIITLYRDPLARNVSSFFENLNHYFSEEECSRLTFERLEQRFNSLDRMRETPIRWFEQELCRKTKIDIFAHPFDQDAGFAVIRVGKTEIFLCTLERLGDRTHEIASFLNIPDFELHNQNVGGDKWYSALYAEFKQRYNPPPSMLQALYESKAARYFYSSSQREQFQRKWRK